MVGKTLFTNKNIAFSGGNCILFLMMYMNWATRKIYHVKSYLINKTTWKEKLQQNSYTSYWKDNKSCSKNAKNQRCFWINNEKAESQKGIKSLTTNWVENVISHLWDLKEPKISFCQCLGLKSWELFQRQPEINFIDIFLNLQNAFLKHKLNLPSR